MASETIVLIAIIIIVGAAIYEKRRQERKQAERDAKVRDHVMKHAMSWSIETQNDRTKFMDDFKE